MLNIYSNPILLFYNLYKIAIKLIYMDVNILFSYFYHCGLDCTKQSFAAVKLNYLFLPGYTNCCQHMWYNCLVQKHITEKKWCQYGVDNIIYCKLLTTTLIIFVYHNCILFVFFL